MRVVQAQLTTHASISPPVQAPDEPRDAAYTVPAWLSGGWPSIISGAEQEALLGRAPLDLRVNRLKAGLDAVRAELPGAEPVPVAPWCLRLPGAVRMEEVPAFRAGRVEVQDAGSQLVAAACAVAPGMIVVDLCAGAGGKSLALAADMGGPADGRLVACDTDRARLGRLHPRAARAGASVETRLLDPGREREALADLAGGADLVLVDAPCSGTGTWRRNPEARWRLTPERLDRLAALQAHILDLGAELVRPGGHLVYAVCSLLSVEGPAAIDAFFNRHSGWLDDEPFAAGRRLGRGRVLTPLHDGTDGFFVARLRAP